MKNGKFFTIQGKVISSRRAFTLFLCFILTCGILLGALGNPVVATNGNLTLYAPETSTPPTIDGILSPGEWSDAMHYSIYFVPTSPHPPDYIDIFLLSDNNTIYIAYDVQPDNSTDTDDCAYLAFDLNNNGTRDFLLSVSRDFVQYNHVQWKWTNCSTLMWDIAFGFDTTPQETGRIHTIIEIKLGINKTDSSVDQNASTLTHLPFGNSPVGAMFGGYGTLVPGWIYGNSSKVIQFSFLDATMYADLYLGSPPEDGFPGWIIVLAILLPAIGVVTVILILRKKKG